MYAHNHKTSGTKKQAQNFLTIHETGHSACGLQAKTVTVTFTRQRGRAPHAEPSTDRRISLMQDTAAGFAQDQQTLCARPEHFLRKTDGRFPQEILPKRPANKNDCPETAQKKQRTRSPLYLILCLFNLLMKQIMAHHDADGARDALHAQDVHDVRDALHIPLAFRSTRGGTV